MKNKEEKIKGVHPIDLNHWRYWCMMDTVLYWSKKPKGYRQSGAPTPLSRGGGWVALRSAMAILFDYEQEVIEHSIKIGHMFKSETRRKIDMVLPKCICISEDGKQSMKQWAQKNINHKNNSNTAKKILHTINIKDMSGYKMCNLNNEN